MNELNRYNYVCDFKNPELVYFTGQTFTIPKSPWEHFCIRHFFPGIPPKCELSDSDNFKYL